MKIKYGAILFASILFFVCTRTAHAEVIINEVMYDLDGTDTGHEWIELYNTAETPVDLTGWKFSDGSNHNLNTPPANGSVGSLEIEAHGYMILCDNAVTFLADHAGISGSVIDTVMSLGNSGDTLKLIDKDGIEENVMTYTSDQGGAGDGKSLSRSPDATWNGQNPTPNGDNGTDASTPPSDTTGGIVDPPTTDGKKSPPAPEAKIVAMVTAKTTVVANTLVHFDGSVLSPKKEKIWDGRFLWSLGDGYSRVDMKFTPFDYVYAYPGTYIVMLEYHTSPFPLGADIPDATVRILITVIDPTTVISNVFSNGAIELSNKSSYEVDLSNFILEAGAKQFVIPKNTIVLQGRKITFNPKVTGFTSTDIVSIKLNYPSGDVEAQYPEPSTVGTQAKTATKSYNSIPKVSRVAQALPANISSVPISRSRELPYALIFFGVIILIGGGYVGYRWLKQKKTASDSIESDAVGDEFEFYED